MSVKQIEETVFAGSDKAAVYVVGYRIALQTPDRVRVAATAAE